jgi:hypothetical protein
MFHHCGGTGQHWRPGAAPALLVVESYDFFTDTAGDQFALFEAVVALAMLMRRYEFTIDPAAPEVNMLVEALSTCHSAEASVTLPDVVTFPGSS